MRDAANLRLPGSGLHPSHFAALRAEILRTAAELSHEQMLDLADALQGLLRWRRPALPARRQDAWIEGESRTFA